MKIENFLNMLNIEYGAKSTLDTGKYKFYMMWQLCQQQLVDSKKKPLQKVWQFITCISTKIPEES